MLLNKKKDIVGIDIGSSSVKLVQLKEHKGTYTLQNVGLLPLPQEAIVDNTLMDTASIVDALKMLIASLGIKAAEAACSISGNSVIIRKIGMQTMTPDALEDQIQWEAEQYIPFDINDVYLDFQILSEDKTDASRMNVLLVASKKDIINDYVVVLGEAGLKPVVMDIDSFAIQNAFEINYDVGPEEVIALVNIGASIMNMNIIKGGVSLFTRDVQVGGNLYTEEIQKQLGVSGTEAEEIKIRGLGHEKVRDLMSRVNETLATEMMRSLDFYNSNAGDEKIARVFLSGGGAKNSLLPDAVAQRLGLPVDIINPFQKIKYSEKDFDPEYLQEIGPLVTVAVGLATRRVGDK